MLGDSNTEDGSWTTWFPGLVVRQCGVRGDTTTTILARIESIMQVEAPRVCIALGINDFAGVDAPVAVVAENYRRIVARLAGRSTQVLVQSTILCNPGLAGPDFISVNARILALNGELASLAGNHVQFIDLNTQLSSDGVLRADVSDDGVHLNALGYDIWRTRIADFVLA